MEKRDDFLIPEELGEWIGLKKSEFLSKLIEHMHPDDFSFEEFHQFNDLVSGTIEKPDAAYEMKLDKQILRSYMRAYPNEGGLFQVALGVLVPDESTNSQVYIPILIFVSRNMELVRDFMQGEPINRPTLN